MWEASRKYKISKQYLYSIINKRKFSQKFTYCPNKNKAKYLNQENLSNVLFNYASSFENPYCIEDLNSKLKENNGIIIPYHKIRCILKEDLCFSYK